ncbi:hypothetical protein LUZ60_010995 [Juncus effusus]|nr:hypothetical protein LUZ60_010995 [Juncus effusus]
MPVENIPHKQKKPFINPGLIWLGHICKKNKKPIKRTTDRERDNKDMASEEGSKRVCVTGGSGFIGSWLVRLLLRRGYTVHATVKNLQDESETKHLLAMDGAESQLRLFQIDLLDFNSILTAIDGTIGVFHLASPLILSSKDPENELLEPAVKGTLNVLRAAKDCGVKRVMLTSSTATMTPPNSSWPSDAVITEDCWADAETLKKLQLWYPLSKFLAERAAWEFVERENLEMVVINPGMVLGPIIPPSIGATAQILLSVLQGEQLDLNDMYIGCVDVRDVAKGMILIYENLHAKGRHFCEESVARWVDFVDKVAELCPEFPVQRVLEDKQSWVVRSEKPAKKLIDLGLEFTPIEKTIKDIVESLRSKGLV